MTTRPLLVITLHAAAAILASACASPGGAPAREVGERAPAAEPDVVVLDRAAQERAGIVSEPARQVLRAEQITAPGIIELDETRTARVGSLQEGLVLETPALVGSRVQRGELLATMHGHAVHDAWAGYRKAVADRRRLQKALAYASNTLARAERLYAAKAISLQERQRAEVDQVSAKEQLDMAEAEVRRSIEELEHIGIRIDEEAAADHDMPESTEQIPVRSPIHGVVLERLVTPGTTVVPGTPMFVVSELSTLWAVAALDESHLSRVRIGRPVEVRVAAYPKAQFTGTITFIGDVVNPKTRRISVRATVPNPDGLLKPEMYATITVGESEPRSVSVVPREAVQAYEGKSVVFVTESDGRFRARPVEVGSETGPDIEIVAGLASGDRIVTRGSFVLKSELMKPVAQAEH